MKTTMRWHILFFLTVILIFPLAGMSQQYAQTGKGAVMLSTGLNIPRSPVPVRKYWELGVSFGTGYSYRIRQNLELRGTVCGSYQMMDELKLYDNARLPEHPDISVEGGNVFVVSTLVEAVSFYSGGKGIFFPYFSGGIGVTSFIGNDADLYYKESKLINAGFKPVVSMALSLGSGFNVFITDYLTMFLEGKYILGLRSGLDTRSFLLHFGALIPLR